jgi:hypothetical protein
VGQIKPPNWAKGTCQTQQPGNREGIFKPNFESSDPSEVSKTQSSSNRPWESHPQPAETFITSPKKTKLSSEEGTVETAKGDQYSDYPKL